MTQADWGTEGPRSRLTSVMAGFLAAHVVSTHIVILDKAQKLTPNSASQAHAPRHSTTPPPVSSEGLGYHMSCGFYLDVCDESFYRKCSLAASH